MAPSIKIQDIVNLINKIGFQSGPNNFIWFEVFRYDSSENQEFLTIEIYQNIGRDNYGWDMYKINISHELLCLLDIEKSGDLEQISNKLKRFIKENGSRITGQEVARNI